MGCHKSKPEISNISVLIMVYIHDGHDTKICDNQCMLLQVVECAKQTASGKEGQKRKSVRDKVPLTSLNDSTRNGTINVMVQGYNSAQETYSNVRGGSMYLNHPELVHKHPANLVSPVKM